jgi:hypothetical protein
MTMRESSLVLAAVVLAAATTGAAAAATLGLSSRALTTHSSPVTIAPTTCTPATAADSHVSELLSLSNFGTSTTLDVRSLLLDNARAFVRFDLGSCSIPANALVVAASLELRLLTAPSASRTHDVRRVTAAWTETGVTWSNQPGVAGTATASAATETTPDVTLAWDVTADVQAFVAGTANHGWRVGDRTESSVTSRAAQYGSRQHATSSSRPTLSISYFP